MKKHLTDTPEGRAEILHKVNDLKEFKNVGWNYHIDFDTYVEQTGSNEMTVDEYLAQICGDEQ